jgi:hypothetical protein
MCEYVYIGGKRRLVRTKRRRDVEDFTHSGENIPYRPSSTPTPLSFPTLSIAGAAFDSVSPDYFGVGPNESISPVSPSDPFSASIPPHSTENNGDSLQRDPNGSGPGSEPPPIDLSILYQPLAPEDDLAFTATNNGSPIDGLLNQRPELLGLVNSVSHYPELAELAELAELVNSVLNDELLSQNPELFNSKCSIL